MAIPITAFVQIAIVLLPRVIDLAQQAEAVYSGAKEGELKKKYVLNAIRTVIDTIDEFRDGTSEYKEMVVNIADYLIEFVVGTFNATGLWDKDIEFDIKPGDKLV